MPTYDYFCKVCEKDKEVTHRMDEKPIITCNTCGRQINKVIRMCNVLICPSQTIRPVKPHETNELLGIKE